MKIPFRTVAVLAALAWQPAVQAYSFVPLSVEDTADLSPCVVEGTIVAQKARRDGAAIVTDHTVSVARRAGECPAVAGGTVTVRTFGGTLPDGESMRIEGIEPLASGGPWVMFLEPGWFDAAGLVTGPHGAIRLAPEAGGKTVRATDAAGSAVTLAADPKTGAAVFGRGAPGLVERWRDSVKGRGEAQAVLDRDALFTMAAARLAANAADRAAKGGRRSTAGEAVLTRLAGERPGSIGDGKSWSPLPASVPAPARAPATVTVEVRADGSRETVSAAPAPAAPCVRRPVAEGQAEEAGCLAEGDKYAFIDFADRTWNPFPSTFGSYYRIDQSSMVEWNRYADHFRVLTTPTGTYGLNGTNDLGGWPASDALAATYGYSWGTNTLGVTITKTWCSEITREYFLGILIREYCSQYTTDSDVFLNPAYTWTADDTNARFGSTTAYSAREVLQHELGHGFGLGHSAEAAVMRACSTAKGWLPWSDDVAGARARWPAKARYGASANVRLVQAGTSTGACGSEGRYLYDASVWRTTNTVNVGAFTLMNFDNVAVPSLTIEWYLTQSPLNFAAGTYAYLGSTTHGPLAPGLTAVPAQSLPMPATSFGRAYLTAFIRTGAGSGDRDSSRYTLLACTTPPGVLPLASGATVDAWLGPADCGENMRSFRFTGVRGQPERFDQRSNDFDTLLRLVGPDGTTIATNDDFGGTLNSRISIVLPADGDYTVVATSYTGTAMGNFAISRADPEADDDGDNLPNGDEVLEGRNATLKDNDLFTDTAASARLFVMQQYRDFLGRRGDATGIQGWVDAIVAGTHSRALVIDSFLRSPEFEGSLAPVARLYFATFRRVPDYAGLTHNAGQVRQGSVSLVQLADFFVASPEFAATYGALGDVQFVTLLYQNVLGRASDAAGLAGWVAALNGGASRGQVLLGFAESAEYRAAMAEEVYVTMMYVGMLRRSPEAGGYDGWLAYLHAGGTPLDMVSGFFQSAEYRARFLP